MIDFNAAADTLYGETQAAPAPQTPVTGAPTEPASDEGELGAFDDDHQADDTQQPDGEDDQQSEQPRDIAKLSPEEVAANVPEEVAAARAADEGRKLYSPQTTFAEAVPDTLADALTTAGLPAETAAAVVAEVREIAADLNLSADDVKTIGAALERAPTQPLTRAQLGERWDATVDALNREFGQGAKSAFDNMQRFLAADPRRMQMLAPVGTDPDTVLRLARAASRARAAGKIY